MIVLALGTTFAFSYVTRSFLDRSLNIGINPAVRSVLFGALSVAKASYNDRRESLRRIGERLRESREAQAAFRAGDLSALRALLAAQEGGDRVTDAALLRFGPGDPSPSAGLGVPLSPAETAAALLTGPYLYRDERQRDMLRMLVPFRDGERLAGALALSERLDPTYFTIEQAAQTYEDIALGEQAIRSAYLHAFLAVAGVVLLAAGLLGVWIAFGVTHPLRDLVRGTRELARDNLSHRIPRHREDEIGLLIDSFNRMAADLQENRKQRLEVEKVAAWREIARRLAHEIKNPLTPIQLTVQQMRDKYQGSDPVYRRLLDDCAEIVTDEVESLKNLVRAFADFARLPDLRITPVDLGLLVEDVARLYAETRLTLVSEGDLPPVAVDEAQIRRALINLIENAEDAAGREGGITIATRWVGRRQGAGGEEQGSGRAAEEQRSGGAEEHGREVGSPAPLHPGSLAMESGPDRGSPAADGGWVELEVSDTGAGIPTEHIDRIFEPYFSTKRTGMGLGLAIVRNIVEQHGGAISVTNRGGSGAAFTIRLPAAGIPEPTPIGNREA
jgi:nitrogen fixation/metabolism regulation signal transduction histidine kinase